VIIRTSITKENFVMTDSVKAALYTALWTFIGVFGVSLLGWIGDVAVWASSDTEMFPSVTPLGKAAVAALAAAAAGFVGWVVRWTQSHGWLPGEAPQYAHKTQSPPPPDTQ
jgi:hypothetical protein